MLCNSQIQQTFTKHLLGVRHCRVKKKKKKGTVAGSHIWGRHGGAEEDYKREKRGDGDGFTEVPAVI